MNALFAAVVFAFAGGVEQAPKLDGTYDVLSIAPNATKAEGQDPKTTPPGQIRRFVVQGARCAMFDMMVGFQGKLKLAKGEVTIRWYEGPSGKLKKPEIMRFALSKDTKNLTQIGPRDRERLVFKRVSGKPLIKLPY